MRYEEMATHNYKFVQSPSRKLFPKEHPIFKVLGTISDSIDESHGSDSDIPNTFFFTSKANAAIAIVLNVDIWES